MSQYCLYNGHSKNRLQTLVLLLTDPLRCAASSTLRRVPKKPDNIDFSGLTFAGSLSQGAHSFSSSSPLDHMPILAPSAPRVCVPSSTSPSSASILGFDGGGSRGVMLASHLRGVIAQSKSHTRIRHTAGMSSVTDDETALQRNGSRWLGEEEGEAPPTGRRKCRSNGAHRAKSKEGIFQRASSRFINAGSLAEH